MQPVVERAPSPDPLADGRRRRGDASREVILVAACEVVTDEGVHALTHRKVAAVAGVSLARVSYHFPTIDDLMVSASLRYLEAFDARLRASTAEARLGDRSIVDACTTVLHDLVTTEARGFLAMVELRLALARRGRTIEAPALVAEIASFGASDTQARSIIASMFGFAVLAAAEPVPVGRAEVETHVRTIVEMAS